jgi:hypothetical protein
MTETLQRPAASVPPQPAGRGVLQQPLVVGVRWALTAAVLGLLVVALPVVAAWAGDPRSSATLADCARTVGQVWLAAHGAAIELPGGRFDLAPLGLALLPLALLARAGRATSLHRRATSVRGAARAAASVAVPYAGLSAGVAAASATAGLRPSVPSAAAAGLLAGLAGAGAGALRPDRLWRAAWLRLGDRTRRTLPAAAAAVSALLAAGALLVGGSLLGHFGRATDLAAATAPGVVGGAGLLLLGLSYVPNAVVWGASWLAGPGFALGSGTAVGPFASELGAVPAVPLLAALPSGSLPGWVGVLVLAVPLTAGAAAGRVLHGRSQALSRTRVALDVLATAGWSGAAAALLAVLAGGSVGGARLAEVGPAATTLGLAVAAHVAVGALAAVVLLRRRSGPAEQQDSSSRRPRR